MADRESAEVRNRALQLLARREHSRQELLAKLQSRGAGASRLLDAVLEQLQAEGLQSDQRYAEAFVRDRIRRGQGPLRIQRDLRERGIPKAVAQACLVDARADWEAQARQVRSKRFGAVEPAHIRERARQVRFLEYRGFTAGQIRASFQCRDD